MGFDKIRGMIWVIAPVWVFRKAQTGLLTCQCLAQRGKAAFTAGNTLSVVPLQHCTQLMDVQYVSSVWVKHHHWIDTEMSWCKAAATRPSSASEVFWHVWVIAVSCQHSENYFTITTYKHHKSLCICLWRGWRTSLTEQQRKGSNELQMKEQGSRTSGCRILIRHLGSSGCLSLNPIISFDLSSPVCSDFTVAHFHFYF